MGWTILGLDLGVMGLLLVLGVASALTLWLAPESAFAQQIAAESSNLDARDIVLNSILLLVCGAFVPMLAIALTRRDPWDGMLRYLRLERPWPASGYGVLLGLGLVAAVYVLVLVGVALYALSTGQGIEEVAAMNDSEAVEGIVAAATVPLALLLAVSAGLGEEVLFRGLLQRYVGVWGQAALFALLHISYGTVVQVIMPFGLGLFFGYMVKRGHSLWLCIVAHATFNLTQLLLARLV